MAADKSRRVSVDAQRKLETTTAIRVKIALANKRCPECGQSVWDIYKTEGSIRYIKCRGCGRNDKIAVTEPTQAPDEQTGSGAQPARKKGRPRRSDTTPKDSSPQSLSATRLLTQA